MVSDNEHTDNTAITGWAVSTSFRQDDVLLYIILPIESTHNQPVVETPVSAED